MNSSNKISATTVVKRSPHPLSTDVDGETVLMSISRGCYYGLDAVGSDIWRRLEQPVSVARLCEDLSRAYAAAPDVILRDVSALLERMNQEGLVEWVL